VYLTYLKSLHDIIWWCTVKRQFYLTDDLLKAFKKLSS